MTSGCTRLQASPEREYLHQLCGQRLTHGGTIRTFVGHCTDLAVVDFYKYIACHMLCGVVLDNRLRTRIS